MKLDGQLFSPVSIPDFPISMYSAPMGTQEECDRFVSKNFIDVSASGGCISRYLAPCRPTVPEVGPGGHLVYPVAQQRPALLYIPAVPRGMIFDCVKMVGFARDWPDIKSLKVQDFIRGSVDLGGQFSPIAFAPYFIIFKAVPPAVVTSELVESVHALNLSVFGVRKARHELVDEKENCIRRGFIAVGEI